MATQTSTSSSISQTPEEALFQALSDYTWDSDAEFQTGLQAILGPDPSPSQAQHLTLRARCFYFSRKTNVPVDFNAYQAWLARQPSESPSPANGTDSTPPDSRDRHSSAAPAVPQEDTAAARRSEPPAPYPTSFSQIVELITNGEPIPGIKEIPDTILEGQVSQPSTAKRKKPWEKGGGGEGEEGLAPTATS